MKQEQTSNQNVDEMHPQRQRSLAEWVSFSIAFSILTSVVGLVGYLWVEQEYQNPPELAVVPSGPIREAQGQFYVPFTVRNTGGSTAASVQVIAELRLADGNTELGEQQIDFLANGETESGAFIFSSDPRSGEFTLRVASYMLP